MGPGEILNWLGYLSGHSPRRLIAKTYIKVLVLKSTTIDSKLVQDKGSYQYFQKLAFCAQESNKITEALKENLQVQKEEYVVKTERARDHETQSWDKEPCSTVKYLIIAVLHLLRIFVCCLWISFDRISKKLHSDDWDNVQYGHHTFSDAKLATVKELQDNLLEMEKILDWALVIIDCLTNSLEFLMLITQAYYAPNGVLINSVRFTSFHAFKTQFLHWLLTSLPLERMAGKWQFRQYLACNRFLGSWRIYSMKQWIINRYPGKIKILGIVWVVILYTKFLAYFTCLIILRIEFTCNPNMVKSFMICFVDRINRFSVTIGDERFMELADIRAEQPYDRTMFMNHTLCWMPGDNHRDEDTSNYCSRQFEEVLMRYWTFSRLSSSFGEGREYDYVGMKHGPTLQPLTLLIVALYDSAQTLTLTGFGEFNLSHSDGQMIFYMILVLFSFIINTYISVQFLAPRVEASKSINEHHDRLEVQIQYLKDKEVPMRLIDDLCHHLNTTFLNIAAVDQFLEDVPDVLLKEFKFISFRDTLKKNILFQRDPDGHLEIIHLLAANVHPLYLPQNAMLLRKEDVADMVYFQGDGEVLSKTESRFSCSGVSQAFGDMEDGLSIWSCTITTLTPCFFLVISKVNILKIFHMYPLAKHNLKKLFRGLPDFCCHEHERKHQKQQTVKRGAVNASLSRIPSYVSKSTEEADIVTFQPVSYLRKVFLWACSLLHNVQHV